MCKWISNKSYTYKFGKFNYVQTNDWFYIVTVKYEYLKPFNCVQTND